MKKLFKTVISVVLLFSLLGCTQTPADNNNNTGDPVVINLELINDFLNTSGDLGPGTIGNEVAVVPIAHIDGPRNESSFYAFVNFKYKARDYIKYQITYLSCTCRAASVNYWQTAYVEISLPESRNADDAELRFLSFDADSNREYLGGFWGDSSPTPAGAFYKDFKDEFIPYFFGKQNSYLKTLSTMWDIDESAYTAGEGRADLTLDTFTGSSVSTNNIIRMIHAIMEYHATDEFFN